MVPNKRKSNPEIGMQSGSFEEIENLKTGSKAFFDGLENKVNGGIQDAEATQSQPSGPTQVTRNIQDGGSNKVAEQSNNGTDWQKRYTDSSREAVKWRDKFKQVEKFTPILQAMKNDSGLVDHVRDYLTSGGQPAKSIQDKLKLDEDFVFDQQKRNQMSDEDFNGFKEQAKGHTLTLDDIHYVLNKDKTAQNVASNTKQEMLNQMKSVRSMPTSASGANSQGVVKSEDRTVFDNILGFDDNVDNLFG